MSENSGSVVRTVGVEPVFYPWETECKKDPTIQKTNSVGLSGIKKSPDTPPTTSMSTNGLEIELLKKRGRGNTDVEKTDTEEEVNNTALSNASVGTSSLTDMSGIIETPHTRASSARNIIKKKKKKNRLKRIKGKIRGKKEEMPKIQTGSIPTTGAHELPIPNGSPNSRSIVKKLISNFNEEEHTYDVGFDAQNPIRDIMPREIQTFAKNCVDEQKPIIFFNGKKIKLNEFIGNDLVKEKKFLAWFIETFQQKFSLSEVGIWEPSLQVDHFYKSSIKLSNTLSEFLRICFSALEIPHNASSIEKTEILVIRCLEVRGTDKAYRVGFEKIWIPFSIWLQSHSLQIWRAIGDEKHVDSIRDRIFTLYEKYQWRKLNKNQMPLNCFLNSFTFSALFHCHHKLSQEICPQLFSMEKSKAEGYYFQEDNNSTQKFKVIYRVMNIFTVIRFKSYHLVYQDQNYGKLDVEWSIHGTFSGKSFCSHLKKKFTIAEGLPEEVQHDIARKLLNH